MVHVALIWECKNCSSPCQLVSLVPQQEVDVALDDPPRACPYVWPREEADCDWRLVKHE